jgi:hypothetical protein
VREQPRHHDEESNASGPKSEFNANGRGSSLVVGGAGGRRSHAYSSEGLVNSDYHIHTRLAKPYHWMHVEPAELERRLSEAYHETGYEAAGFRSHSLDHENPIVKAVPVGRRV